MKSFKGLSDFQLGDEKVTLNHQVVTPFVRPLIGAITPGRSCWWLGHGAFLYIHGIVAFTYTCELIFFMANVSSWYLLYMDPRGVKLFHDFGLVFFCVDIPKILFILYLEIFRKWSNLTTFFFKWVETRITLKLQDFDNLFDVFLQMILFVLYFCGECI